MRETTGRQLDLFVDGGPLGFERDLVTALEGHRFPAAAEALERLTAARPDHPALGAFATLIDDGRRLREEAFEPARYLDLLESRLVPAARALGRRGEGFLAPFWRRLADLLRGQGFDPGSPACHSSYAAARVRDWRSVRAAVEGERAWHREPVLIARLLEAAGHLGEDGVALEALCRLCWDFPDAADAWLARGSRFGADLRAFGELDEALPVVDFPAWQALRRRRPLPLPEVRNRAALVVAAAVNAVLAELPGTPDVSARRRLRELHPALFELFMAMQRRALR